MAAGRDAAGRFTFGNLPVNKSILNREVQGGTYLLVQGLTQAFVDALQGATGSMSKQLEVLAEHLRNLNNDPSGRTEMYRRVGKQGQEAMLQAYEELVIAREGRASASHYRSGDNRLPLKLGDALASEEFFAAGPDGLAFGNIEFLDKEAAHWHRVNFGAAPAGEGAGAGFYSTLNGIVIAELGLDDGPSPGVVLPRGFFFDPETGKRVAAGRNPNGTDAFRPQTGGSSYSSRGKPLGNATRNTAGIVAKNFMDRGVEVIARQLPLALQDYYQRGYRAALENTGPLSQFDRNILVRPRQLPSRAISI